MSIEIVKFHTSTSALDAQVIMGLLQRAQVEFRVVRADTDEEIFAEVSDRGFEPVDVYIHRDDLLRADKMLRPILVG